MVSSVAFADAYKTLTFPDDNSENNKVNGYVDTWTAKIGKDSWSIANFNNNQWKGWTYIRCGRKSDASVASIATDFAIDQPISSVVVTFDKIDKDDKINSISLLVASDADFANVIETVEAPNKEAGDMLFEIKNPTANSYYKLVVDCQSAGSNGIVQISKIQYYKQGDEPEIIDISNTPETAYTVAKAHELIEAGKGLATSVYVKGVITEIRNFDSKYGQLNYYINDANGTGDDLYVYGGLYLGGEKFDDALFLASISNNTAPRRGAIHLPWLNVDLGSFNTSTIKYDMRVLASDINFKYLLSPENREKINDDKLLVNLTADIAGVGVSPLNNIRPTTFFVGISKMSTEFSKFLIEMIRPINPGISTVENIVQFGYDPNSVEFSISANKVYTTFYFRDQNLDKVSQQKQQLIAFEGDKFGLEPMPFSDVISYLEGN